MKFHILTLIATLSFGCQNPPALNKDLKSQLHTVRTSDQEIRELCYGNISGKRREELNAKYDVDFQNNYKLSSKKMDQIDRNNLRIIKKIIEQFGYPKINVVDTPLNETVWLIIQHNPNELEKYMPLLEKAGKAGDIEMTKVALSQDRMLMNQGKEQIYGSQGSSISQPIGTKQNQYTFFIWPIKNPNEVNKRRAEVGFKTTIEEYAKLLNMEYEPLTLEDVKAMEE